VDFSVSEHALAPVVQRYGQRLISEIGNLNRRYLFGQLWV